MRHPKTALFYEGQVVYWTRLGVYKKVMRAHYHEKHWHYDLDGAAFVCEEVLRSLDRREAGR